MRTFYLLASFIVLDLIQPAYAYNIGQTLTIENTTAVPMDILIEQPPGLRDILKPIPAGGKATIYTESNDNSGWLRNTTTVTFSIRKSGTPKAYIKGRIAYDIDYIRSSSLSKSSFLDSLLVGKGITLDTIYSCRKTDGSNIQNKIVIRGTPGDEVFGKFTDKVRCEGLKSSSLNENTYRVECYDKTSAVFSKRYPEESECIWEAAYKGGPSRSKGCYWQNMNSKEQQGQQPLQPGDKTLTLKEILDKDIGNSYCES